MRKLFVRTYVVVCLLSFVGVAGAAPFVNLDFEQSTVQPGDPTIVPTSAAFPGWTAWFGNTTSDSLYHDYGGAGEAIVAIFDHEVIGAGLPLLQGSYMPFIAPSSGDLRTSLSQTGDIPVGTKSLRLLADGEAGAPVVTVDGKTIPMVRISGTIFHGVAMWGGDASAFSGSTHEVRFFSGPRQEFHSGRRVFDDIQFSTDPIPEPTIVGAVVIAMSWLVCCRHTRTRNHVAHLSTRKESTDGKEAQECSGDDRIT